MDRAKERGDLVEGEDGLLYERSRKIQERQSQSHRVDIQGRKGMMPKEDAERLLEEFSRPLDWAMFALVGKRKKAIKDGEAGENKKPPSTEAARHLQEAFDKTQRTASSNIMMIFMIMSRTIKMIIMISIRIKIGNRLTIIALLSMIIIIVLINIALQRASPGPSTPSARARPRSTLLAPPMP